MIVAGIDGGQSSTVAVVGNGDGRVVGRGVAGPSDEVAQGRESTRMHDALAAALHAALADAGLPPETHLEAVVAGVSGFEGRVYGKFPELPATRFFLMHDAPVAHAGALGGHPGVVVIAGTGSVVYATDGKRGWMSGGWGYLFGDEGSAFWFVRSMLTELMLCEDLSDGPYYAHETLFACEYFGLPSLRAVARAFYAGELSRERVASFAKEIMDWPQMRKRVQAGASHLALLVRDAISAGAPSRVACVGGMFEDAWFAQTLRAFISRGPYGAEIVPPKYEPAVGALLLAYREAGAAHSEVAL
jgi:N-acetylglucosamine kinase-like BadF-type ATPase